MITSTALLPNNTHLWLFFLPRSSISFYIVHTWRVLEEDIESAHTTAPHTHFHLRAQGWSTLPLLNPSLLPWRWRGTGRQNFALVILCIKATVLLLVTFIWAVRHRFMSAMAGNKSQGEALYKTANRMLLLWSVTRSSLLVVRITVLMDSIHKLSLCSI